VVKLPSLLYSYPYSVFLALRSFEMRFNLLLGTLDPRFTHQKFPTDTLCYPLGQMSMEAC